MPSGKEMQSCELPQGPSAIHVRNLRTVANISLYERPLNGEGKREARVASGDGRI